MLVLFRLDPTTVLSCIRGFILVAQLLIEAWLLHFLAGIVVLICALLFMMPWTGP